MALLGCGEDAPGIPEADGGAPPGTGGSAQGGRAQGGSAQAGSAQGGSGISGNGSGGSAGGGVGGNIPVPDEPLSQFIVVDDFGYRPAAQKVAVIRDPVTGFDGGEGFTPSASYALVDAFSGEHVLSAAPIPWNGGAEDGSSGDRASWFDFSAVTTPSAYYVLDTEQGVRSPVFVISSDVYREVLKHAVRTFFYQRAGQAKQAMYAGEAWADGASHIGPGQDTEARSFTDQGNASSARDLSGGWYDAGDFNKYTSWQAEYVLDLLRAYSERPEIWSDDYGIPESGNGVPDVLDETKWGLDWIVKMQNDDGSLLSIVGLEAKSPPSSATEPSYYGAANTSASLGGAAAFAFGATVFATLGPDFATYADDLRDRAERAWQWANANPNVIFRNNDAGSGTSGLGAGQQETDDNGRLMKKLEAACYLFELTGDSQYRTFFDQNYGQTTIISSGYTYAWEEGIQETLLHYASLPDASADVAADIRDTYTAGVLGGDNLPAHAGNVDPYRAPLADYTWGSNSTKAREGLVFQSFVKYGLSGAASDQILTAAEGYLHYLHGVNPLGIVYLSNMGAYGAERSVKEFYHSWFVDGSASWDRVGESTHGPAPGFMPGGPNPGYDWDGCCPGDCSGISCGAAPPSPPAGQPEQKAYLDFNDQWPLDSWSVTENSDGYQSGYIRLLSKFVD